jgi:hypothetical protein
MEDSKSRPALVEALVGTAALLGLGWALLHVTGCGGPGDREQPAAVLKTAFAPPPAPKVGPPDSESDDPPEEIGPLAEARGQVRKFEKKRQALEPVLERALAERDELAAKLREAGVTQPSDLKGNLRGQKLADSLTKLSAEIEKIDRQAAALDSAILDAKAVVRRLERQQAGISEEERVRLAEQLREAEERTDGAAQPVTPLDLEAALEKALKGSPGPSLKTTPRQGAAILVGKWQLAEGKRSGTVEFTRGGTALLAWDDGITNALGQRQRRATLKYTLKGNILLLEEPGEFEYRQMCDVQIEFSGQDEIILVNQKNSLSFDWLDGRAKRVR